MAKKTWREWLLIIATFGCINLVLKNKAKKSQSTTNDKLVTSSKIHFDINELIKALGSKNNITKCDCSMSTVKVFLKDLLKINEDFIKKNVASGLLKSQSSITLVCGDNAAAIAEAINKNL